MNENNLNEEMQEQQTNEQNEQPEMGHQGGRPQMMGGGQMNGRPPMPPQGGQFSGEQQENTEDTTV